MRTAVLVVLMVGGSGCVTPRREREAAAIPARHLSPPSELSVRPESRTDSAVKSPIVPVAHSEPESPEEASLALEPPPAQSSNRDMRGLDIGVGGGPIIADGCVSRDYCDTDATLGFLAEYNFNPVLSIVLHGSYVPADTGSSPWSALEGSRFYAYNNLYAYNGITPAIAPVNRHSDIALALSPFDGELAVRQHVAGLSVFGAAGPGLVRTTFDLAEQGIVSGQDDATQWHPSTVLSAGARVTVGDRVGLRFERRTVRYIERFGGTTLALTKRTMFEASLTFSLPSIGG